MNNVPAQLGQIIDRLATIEALLLRVFHRENKIMATLDDLQNDVNAEDTVGDGITTLLTGLSAQIAALKGTQTDPATAAKIDALDAQIKARTAKLAAAVTANTAAAA